MDRGWQGLDYSIGGKKSFWLASRFVADGVTVNQMRFLLNAQHYSNMAYHVAFAFCAGRKTKLPLSQKRHMWLRCSFSCRNKLVIAEGVGSSFLSPGS